MKDIIKIEIDNFGPINHADINIGELNVIGGLNGTGKSTASKLMYCFLKSVSSKRQIFYLEQNLGKINYVIRELNRCSDLFEYKRLNIADGFDYILDEFYDTYAVFKSNSYDFEDEHVLKMKMDELWDTINMILDNGNQLYESIFQLLLNTEFSSELMGKVIFSSLNESFKYNLNFKNSIWDDGVFNNFGRFNINDVFYIDSISNLDLFRIRIKPPEHIEYLGKNIKWNADQSGEISSKENKIIHHLEKRITNIINGNFNPKNFKFTQDDGKEVSVINTSSGTKQIGIIQLLLSNRKLRNSTFLIIDEPEVNLHPEWQIKLAEILVLLVKELHIIVYINSHSPMFIEAMSIFSEYYSLKDETNIYLTKKQGNGFTFEKIANDDMGAIYENLSRPYDDLDKIKAELLFRK